MFKAFNGASCGDDVVDCREDGSRREVSFRHRRHAEQYRQILDAHRE